MKKHLIRGVTIAGLLAFTGPQLLADNNGGGQGRRFPGGGIAVKPPHGGGGGSHFPKPVMGVKPIGMVVKPPPKPSFPIGIVAPPKPPKPIGIVVQPPKPTFPIGIVAPPKPPKPIGIIVQPPKPPKPIGIVVQPPKPPFPIGIVAPPKPPKPIGIIVPPKPPKPIGIVVQPPKPPFPIGIVVPPKPPKPIGIIVQPPHKPPHFPHWPHKPHWPHCPPVVIGVPQYPIVIGQPYPVQVPVAQGSVVYNLQCALPQGVNAQDLRMVNVDLMAMQNGNFQVFGVIADAEDNEMSLNTMANGSLDDRLDLKMADGDELYLETVQDTAGNRYLQGKVTLLGRSDSNGLACTLSIVQQ